MIDSFVHTGQFTSSELIQLHSLPTACGWCRSRGWWRQKRIINMTEKVGPLVSVHCIGCSLPNPYGFANTAWSRIILFTRNLGILPIDDVIVLHSMVSNCWLRLFTLWLFSGLPGEVLFTSQMKVPNLHILGVFWANYGKKHPILTK